MLNIFPYVASIQPLTPRGGEVISHLPASSFSGMKPIVLLLLLGFPFHVYCQYHDAHWISGAGYEGWTIVPSNKIDFKEYPYDLKLFEGSSGHYLSSITLSDRNGNLLLYSNGIQVLNSQHQKLINGDSLNWNELAEDFYAEGHPMPDGIIGLPASHSDSLFYLIHSLEEYALGFGATVSKILYSQADMRNSHGIITIKNEILWEGALITRLSACRHANGRDWWVMAQDDTLNVYYRALLKPEGFTQIDTQQIGFHPPWYQFKDGGGQNLFTPNGAKYIDFDAWNGLRIYDFDRCSGLLSNPVLITFPQKWSFGAGAAVSPNSRFLYVSSSTWIVQYDLEAPDIASSADTVAIWQGPFPKFARMNLMMDGKIYIMPFSWTHYGHFIRYPNNKGKACEVVLGGIHFPNENSATIPHFPNYRLGPLHGSACDTLGLAPGPLAWWRWDQDTLPLKIQFTDHSAYQPISWHWEFGDGQSANDVNPIHTYMQPGSYQVCLSVCNANACDTMCRTLNLQNVASEEPGQHLPALQVYPNPAYDFVSVVYQGGVKDPQLRLTDISGRTCAVYPFASSSLTIPVETLPSGLYFIQLLGGGNVLATNKLVVAL